MMHELQTDEKQALLLNHGLAAAPPEAAPDKKQPARGGGGVAHGEDTPAYAVLQQYGLLDTSYRRDDFDDIFEPCDIVPNSSHADTLKKKLRWGVYWTPGCGFMLYSTFNTEVVVPPGCICCFIDNDNNYLFARPGVHAITDPFMEMVGAPINLRGALHVVASRGRGGGGGSGGNAAAVGRTDPVVEHGNRTIVTVPQGKLGYATDRGQPVLLPPGLHSWKSETLRYERTFALDDHVIEIGPYTIQTVDEGYAAITQNNGLQVVLDGGQTHLLTHQKWRFEKFITLKIQTDDLESIEAASADNVIMSVDSTVVWKIKDVRIAATMAAETMAQTGGALSADITKLRRDVLKQAIASLAGFIGSVNYSDSFHVAAAAQRSMETAEVVVPLGEGGGAPGVAQQRSPAPVQVRPSADNPMFDTEGMSDAVAHANHITSKFGVEIISINIISANPVDDTLTASLATGAVASAEALQAETQARGMAKAMKIRADAEAVTRKIDADSEALAEVVRAKADAEADVVRAEGAKAAEILRAEGSRKAAELIQGSDVAVRLETMKASASALGRSDKFFFGQEPGYMPSIVMKGPDASVAAAAAIEE